MRLFNKNEEKRLPEPELKRIPIANEEVNKPKKGRPRKAVV